MKKLLGISLVAVLAVAPLMASAATGEAVDTNGTPTTMNPQPTTEQAINAVTASGAPYYALAVEAETDTNAASAGYVKGAYNAAIKAINKVAEDNATIGGAGIDKTNGVISVDLKKNGSTNISGLILDDNGTAANPNDDKLMIKKGNGIEVDSNGVSVNVTSNKGLAFDSTNHTLEIKDGAGVKTGANGVEADLTTNGGLQFNDNGTANDTSDDTIEIKAGTAIDVGATGVSVKYDNSSVGVNASGQLEVKGYDALATKTGVENLIKAVEIDVTDGHTLTTGNGTISVMTSWGDDDAQHATAYTFLNSATLSGTVTAEIKDSGVSYTAANTQSGGGNDGGNNNPDTNPQTENPSIPG